MLTGLMLLFLFITLVGLAVLFTLVALSLRSQGGSVTPAPADSSLAAFLNVWALYPLYTQIIPAPVVPDQYSRLEWFPPPVLIPSQSGTSTYANKPAVLLAVADDGDPAAIARQYIRFIPTASEVAQTLRFTLSVTLSFQITGQPSVNNALIGVGVSPTTTFDPTNAPAVYTIGSFDSTIPARVSTVNLTYFFPGGLVVPGQSYYFYPLFRCPSAGTLEVYACEMSVTIV